MQTYYLIQFLRQAASDPWIGTAHIAIYVALFDLWLANEGRDPVSFTKETVMDAAKVRSRRTFYECMWTLRDHGYIRYLPSQNQVVENLVWMGEVGRDS
jgi:hypothetical protein